MLKGNIPEVYWPNMLVMFVMMIAAVLVSARRFARHSTDRCKNSP